MFAYVTTNVKPLVRVDSMEGRDWLVGPMVMITEGVHSGSDGPIYYPADELEKAAPTWNYRPVVVYHPSANGSAATACDPTELTRRKIGVTLRTQFDAEKKRVRAEAWMEPERLAKVDGRVAEAVENQKMMEVSTGVFMDLERKEGEWNGEKFVGIARNIALDHLAVLPDAKGACSIEDGAGLLRLNEAGDDTLIFEDNVETTDRYVHVPVKDASLFEDGSLRTIWISRSKGIKAVVGKLKTDGEGTTIQKYLFVKEQWSTEDAVAWAKRHKTTDNAWQVILNELSYSAVERLLAQALRQRKGNDNYIAEVHEDYLIYENDGILYRQSYTLDAETEEVEFTGEPVRVRRQVTYITENAVENAEWTARYINDLPDSAFLYIEPGGKKDEEGKTTPRRLRHFPYRDASGKIDLPHLRNALARIPQSKLSKAIKERLAAKARRLLEKAKTQNHRMKGSLMDRDEIINSLIESEHTDWTEDDRDELAAMSEKALTALAAAANEDDAEAAEQRPAEGSSQQQEGQQPADDPTVNALERAEAFVANAPPEVRELLQDGVNRLREERESLVRVIMANERNMFDREQLDGKPIHELRAIAKLAEPKRIALYSGQADER